MEERTVLRPPVKAATGPGERSHILPHSSVGSSLTQTALQTPLRLNPPGAWTPVSRPPSG